jgi:hypothetical protein
MMHAKAIREVLDVVVPEGLQLRTPEGAVLTLGPVAAAVWQACDGQTSVSELLIAARAVDETATANLVWQILDGLADAALLEARVAPAGPILDRRAMLQVAAAAATVVLVPGIARAKKRKVPARADQESKRKQVAAAAEAPAATPASEAAAEAAAPAEAPASEAPGTPAEQAQRRKERKLKARHPERAREHRQKALKRATEAKRKAMHKRKTMVDRSKEEQQK